MESNLTLTIIIPVYNEEKTIAEIMRQIAAAQPEAQRIYVDDGSSDKSLVILRANASPSDIILTKKNGGKGSAVRMGIEKVQGAHIVIQDADLEYDPAEISQLFECANKHPDAAVFGSRFKKKNPNLYRRYLLGNKVLTLLINILFGGRLTDSYTCYKMFPTEILRGFSLQSNGFEMEAELCARTLMQKIAIYEIPISYNPRSLAEGKKICLRDAWKGVYTMLRIRFGLL